jgi:hypothetical protein
MQKGIGVFAIKIHITSANRPATDNQCHKKTKYRAKHYFDVRLICGLTEWAWLPRPPLHTPHVPPIFEQRLQYSQVWQAWQGLAPTQVLARAEEPKLATKEIVNTNKILTI